MALIERNREPSARELRYFGLVMTALLGVLGLLLWRAEARLAAWLLWTAGLLASVVYHALPPARRLMYQSWMAATYPLGWLLSHFILGLTYYFVVTPIGFLMRLLGHDPMRRRREASLQTYWIERRRGVDPSSYLRQF